jgi:hypothetical protein
MEILENFLKNNNKPKTGIDLGSDPDIEWVIRVLKYVDPTDQCHLFSGDNEKDIKIYRQIDQE